MGNGIGIEVDNSAGNSIGGTLSGSVNGSVSGILSPTQTFPAWFTESLTYSGSGSSISGIGNVIGFNQGAGISISGTVTNNGSPPSGNVVLGNLIGLNVVYRQSDTNLPNGQAPQIENAGNLGDGIDLDGTAGAESNSIGFAGTLAYTPTSSGTVTPVLTLADSFISVTSQNFGSSVTAVTLETLPQQNVTAGQSITGTAYLGNIIAANRGTGVSLTGPASGIVLDDVLVGNTIGATSSTPGGATNPLVGNSGNGISITNSLGNTIGSAALASTTSAKPLDGAANVVSGNAGDGISVSVVNTTTPGSNVIAGNLVSFNTQNGIQFTGSLSAGSLQVEIVNNLVGTMYSGTSTVDANGIHQGNGLDGIQLDQAATSIVSGNPSAEVWYNVSSNNALSGIDVVTVNGLSYADVTIYGNFLGTDITGTAVSGTSASSPGQIVPFGNSLDGILLNEVLGVTIGGMGTGQENVISGNLGRGIEVRNQNLSGNLGAVAQPPEELIAGNLIGLGGTGTTVVDANNTSLGNLEEGIYLQDAGAVINGAQPTQIVIQGNTISNNHEAGIHAFEDSGITMSQNGLMIIGNQIGTDPSGTIVEVSVPLSTGSSVLDSLGNGSDGVFLDSIRTAGSQTQLVSITGNVISGNHADGIDLLNSTLVSITGNDIGTNKSGTSAVGASLADFGNASDGMFINQSNRSRSAARLDRRRGRQHHLGQSRQRGLHLGDDRRQQLSGGGTSVPRPSEMSSGEPDRHRFRATNPPGPDRGGPQRRRRHHPQQRRLQHHRRQPRATPTSSRATRSTASSWSTRATDNTIEGDLSAPDPRASTASAIRPTASSSWAAPRSASAA